MTKALVQFPRFIAILVILGSVPGLGLAQDTGNSKAGYNYFDREHSSLDTQSDLNNNALPEPSFSVQTGMMTGLGNDMGTYSYLSPQMRFPVSQRFSLNTGLMLENRPVYGYNQEEGFHSSGQNYNSAYLMAGGDYQIDEHLTLSGSGFMEIPGASGIGSNEGLSNASKGFRMNMHYEVNDHLHFDVGVQMREGNRYGPNPYFNNGFNTSPTPFGRPGRMGGFGYPAGF